MLILGCMLLVHISDAVVACSILLPVDGNSALPQRIYLSSQLRRLTRGGGIFGRGECRGDQ